MDSHYFDENALLHIELPEVQVDQIKVQFHYHRVEISQWIDNLLFSSTNGIISVIKNLRDFNCRHKNLIREAKIHFSNVIYNFVYYSLTVLFEVPFRLQIIIDIIEELLNGQDIFPFVFYALVL